MSWYRLLKELQYGDDDTDDACDNHIGDDDVASHDEVVAFPCAHDAVDDDNDGKDDDNNDDGIISVMMKHQNNLDLKSILRERVFVL